VSLDQHIERVGRQLDALRVEFEKFFAGARQTPPEEMREGIRVDLRRLRTYPMTQLADSFRITQLEARFNSYSELFNRRLREREEGRRVVRPLPAASGGSASDGSTSDYGVTVRGAVAADDAKALYDALARDRAHPPQFDLDSFRSYLQRQAEAIRAKTGCSEVRFRLAEEGGHIKLKAKPIGG
jgi:hypothetical protein